MSDTYLVTFERMADACEAGGHQSCAESGECRSPLERALSEKAAREQAAKFDAGKERLRLQSEQPSPHWTTSALLRTAKDLLQTPPTNDPWWRSVAITTALARLGERGLGADVIVRTGFARDLVQSIVGDAAMFWCASTPEGVDDDDDVEIPDVLQPWVELLDTDRSLQQHRGQLPAHVASVALAGDVGAKAEEWIRTAAIAHILGWRITDYLAVERQPMDLVLAGGKEATVWVTERFTTTYIPEWRASSLHWEQMYNSDPAGAAKIAGVPLDMLLERTVTTEMLTEGLQVKLNRQADTEFEQRDLGDSSIASLAVLLESGQIRAALRMARKFHEAQPQASHFAMAYAFCLIVTDPDSARVTLERRLPAVDSAEMALRTVNLATCALMVQDVSKAREYLASLDGEMRQAAWLWEPTSVVAGDPHVRYSSISEWLDRFELAAEILTPRTDEGPSWGSSDAIRRPGTE